MEGRDAATDLVIRIDKDMVCTSCLKGMFDNALANEQEQPVK